MSDHFYDETDYLTAITEYAAKHGTKPELHKTPHGWLVSVVVKDKPSKYSASAKGRNPKDASQALCLKLKLTPKQTA